MESKRKNKKKAQGEHQRIYIRRSIRRKLQKQWWRIGTWASEAKGPFPGGKRVGSRGKKKKKKKVWGQHRRINIRRSIRKVGMSLEILSVKNVKALLWYFVYGEIFQSRWILPFWSMSAISVVVYHETL